MSEQEHAGAWYDRIRAIVDTAPPLTDRQRDQLKSILNPARTTAPPVGDARPLKPAPRGPAIPPARPASPREARPAVVYFLKAGKRIKIGTTRDLHTRISAIRNASPEPVELLATMPGSRDEEKDLHQRFSHLRTHGEWFRAEAELILFINSLAKAPQ